MNNVAEAAALRDGITYADEWLAYRREFRDIPGLVVAVHRESELLLSKGYGVACLEDAVAITHRFALEDLYCHCCDATR
jgi:hypothetical protein